MTMTEALAKIQTVTDKYSLSATAIGDTEIRLTNRKREEAGKIDLKSGLIMQRYVGQKNMLGSLVRDDLKSALGFQSGKY